MSSGDHLTQEQPADVVCLGMGVTSGIIASELSIAGYKVVGIEKGPSWDYASDFSLTKYDEWGIGVMRKFDHPLPISTFTLRNNGEQMALPVRRWTSAQSIATGHGVGGMAQHYGGLMGRFGPWTYQERSSTANRYGIEFLNQIAPTNDLEDWPLQYTDYVPYYEKFEQAYGVTGPGQDPLVPNSKYPLPPHPLTPIGQMFLSAAESLGYHPYATPTSLASVPYVNQYGVTVNPCVYEGWCGAGCNYVCETGAKANAAYRHFPAAIKTGNFKMALDSYIFRIDTDPDTNLATGVRYYDVAGNVHVQPAKVVWNGTWGFNITRLFQLSGIGTNYNPSTATGTMGRGSSHTFPIGSANVVGSFAVGANSYPAGNALGGGVDIFDLADDEFDHAGLNFIGGNLVRAGAYTGGGPSNFTQVAGTVTASSGGSTFKGSLKDRCLPTKQNVTFSQYAVEIPDRRWNLDLDPHYNDIYGDPLARWTNDFTANSYNGGVYLTGPVSTLVQKMGATTVTVNKGSPVGTFPMDNWPAHVRGGCRIGVDASTSPLNKYHQVWDHQNVFAGGEITNTTGDNTTTGGTHPIGATTYVAAEGIIKYLQSPGPLV